MMKAGMALECPVSAVFIDGNCLLLGPCADEY